VKNEDKQIETNYWRAPGIPQGNRTEILWPVWLSKSTALSSRIWKSISSGVVGSNSEEGGLVTKQVYKCFHCAKNEYRFSTRRTKMVPPDEFSMIVVSADAGVHFYRIEFLTSVQVLLTIPPSRVLSRLFVILREWINALVIWRITYLEDFSNNPVVHSHACYSLWLNQCLCRVDITTESNNDLEEMYSKPSMPKASVLRQCGCERVERI